MAALVLLPVFESHCLLCSSFFVIVPKPAAHTTQSPVVQEDFGFDFNLHAPIPLWDFPPAFVYLNIQAVPISVTMRTLEVITKLGKARNTSAACLSV